GHHVELARVGIRRNVLGEAEQAVRLAGHCRGNHDELMAFAMEARDTLRDVADALDAADGRAAVFLDDQGHARLACRCGARITPRGTRVSRWCRRSRTSWKARRGSACAARYWGRSRDRTAGPA